MAPCTAVGSAGCEIADGPGGEVGYAVTPLAPDEFPTATAVTDTGSARIQSWWWQTAEGARVWGGFWDSQASARRSVYTHDGTGATCGPEWVENGREFLHRRDKTTTSAASSPRRRATSRSTRPTGIPRPATTRASAANESAYLFTGAFNPPQAYEIEEPAGCQPRSLAGLQVFAAQTFTLVDTTTLEPLVQATE